METDPVGEKKLYGLGPGGAGLELEISRFSLGVGLGDVPRRWSLYPGTEGERALGVEAWGCRLGWVCGGEWR